MRNRAEEVCTFAVWFWAALISATAAICAPAFGDDPNVPSAGAAKSMIVPLHQSAVVTAPWPAKRVSVADPKIADIQTLTPQQVLVQAKAIGSTDVIMWSQTEEVYKVRIDVTADLSQMKDELRKLFPRSTLDVSQAHDVIMVTGQLAHADEAVQLRRYFEATGLKFVDMTDMAGVQQVQLKVKVAEVSRTAIRALGINGFLSQSDVFAGQTIGPSGGGGALNPLGVTISPTVAGQASLGASTLTNLPSMTVFGGFPDQHLFLFLQALAENQYLRILAEPTLVALSGEEATFLAGGEIPIPIVSGTVGASSTSGVSITIEYKEYGTRLRFKPMVLGDGAIRLRVAPEVSELSQFNAVSFGAGFSVPTLVVRKAETTLELKSGQSFAMAGLIQHNDTADNSRIPGLGDVPVLGALFRSMRYQADDTELVVMVTATLVEPSSTVHTPPLPGALHVIPNDWELYGLGRIEGQGPARLSPSDAAWLKDNGLGRIQGPGAWESYGQSPARSQATVRPPQNAPAAQTPSTMPAASES